MVKYGFIYFKFCLISLLCGIVFLGFKYFLELKRLRRFLFRNLEIRVI